MKRSLRLLRAFLALAGAIGASLNSSGAAGQDSGPAPARPPPRHAEAAARPPAQRQSKLQAEQRELQARLDRLKQSLASAEAAHSEASDALAESESSISAANRRLHELAGARAAGERALADVRERQRAATSRQGEQERHLAALLRAQLGADQPGWWPRPAHGAPLGLDAAAPGSGQDRGGVGELYDRGDPDELGYVGYVGYVVAARVRAIGELRDRRAELAGLEQEARARQAELTQIAGEERRNRGQLVRQQAVRKRVLVTLAQQIKRQRQSVAGLERDEQRLGKLIQQLALALAPPRAPRAPPHGAAGPTAPLASLAFEPPPGSGLAQLRGRLRLPVAGELVGRYGTARRGEDGSAEAAAPSWKGVFIKAASGTEVHAIAAGRVVFADWLRGFGNLMILDHGDGFLSVYGNNESLLRSVGDRVLADEVIAVVGDTGGSAESGLYFEMRYEGHPLDPLSWAAAR